MTYDLSCLWESANGHTLLSDPDAIRTGGPESESWESCVTGIYPRHARLVHEGGIRLIPQLYSWDYGSALVVPPAPC